LDLITIHLPGILLAYGVLMIGIFSPGPAILTIIGLSLAHGRRPGMAVAAGVVTGSTFWGLLAAAGMAGLLARYADAVIVIKILGGVYMFWLAYKSIRAACTPHRPTTTIPATNIDSLTHYWFTGLAIHLTNPKAIFTWLAAISFGVDAGSPIWVGFVIVAGGFVISSLGNLAYAILFSTDHMARLYLIFRRRVEALLGAFFIVAGVKLISDR
jgi:threonine/homoserine/homoserine lactone efflux protein